MPMGKDHPKYEFIEILQKEHRRLRDKLNEFLSFARPSPACIIANNLNDIVNATVTLALKQALKNRMQPCFGTWQRIERHSLGCRPDETDIA